jgi:hypothetical protein
MSGIHFPLSANGIREGGFRFAESRIRFGEGGGVIREGKKEIREWLREVPLIKI